MRYGPVFVVFEVAEWPEYSRLVGFDLGCDAPVEGHSENRHVMPFHFKALRDGPI